MKKAIDLTGQRFGKLVVIKRADWIKTKTNGANWLCRCDCGNEKIVASSYLFKGHTKSCGCYSFRWKENIIRHNSQEHRKLFAVYRNIIKRCYDKNFKQYKDYGGRGIIMCDEWLKNFEKFYSWAINNGYRKELSIDRINNDGNYEPNNCRWATIKEQSFNKRNTIILEYNNEKHTAKEWSKIIGISYSALLNRVKKKMPLEKIFYKGKLEEIGILDYDRVC
jgi:hypothetical protein